MKQVAEMTQDSSDGTLSKRNALVRAYVQAIAATKGMGRAKYTPESESVRTWRSDLYNAGRRLSVLSYRYANPSSYRCSIYIYGRSDVSDEALYKEFCKELSRQQKFVSGLKPAKAVGRKRTARIPG